MDTIDMYPFKLIGAPLFVWLMVAVVGLVFLFLSDYRIVSDSPLLATGKACSGIVNLLLLVSRVTQVEIWTYESHETLRSCTLPYICMMCVVCVGWA